MKNINFKTFLENLEEKFDSIDADIPLPKEVYQLSHLFAQNKSSLYAVGGAIRDYLYSIHHGGHYSPKDVDLATEASPETVINILKSPESLKQGIKTFPKGEAFGVISAIVNGEEFEIATFREDGQYSDGRRPDSVSFSTPSKDAKRRDLTMNALFYDIEHKQIRDYNLDANGEGMGLKDIKNLTARPVGVAKERFREDKLRIPRLIRFFSRFNAGNILNHLDSETLAAIEEFKDLIGVSPERISAEFISGLSKAKDVSNYILNYKETGLLPALFPNLKVNLNDINKINNSRNVKAILAWILRDNDIKLVRQKLNKIKYSNEITDSVTFLLNLFHFDINQIAQLLKRRDMYSQLEEEPRKIATATLRQDVFDFAKIAGITDRLSRFMNYQSPVNSNQFGNLAGEELGQAIKKAQINAYDKYSQGNQ